MEASDAAEADDDVLVSATGGFRCFGLPPPPPPTPLPLTDLPLLLAETLLAAGGCDCDCGRDGDCDCDCDCGRDCACACACACGCSTKGSEVSKGLVKVESSPLVSSPVRVGVGVDASRQGCVGEGRTD